MNFAFLFPGQGSQRVGMGADLFAATELADSRFSQASEILGVDLKKIVLEGPEEELKRTEYTQPALFTVESIIVDLLAEKGITPSVTMGHSLGEYGALYGAGVIDFATGIKLVAKRGALMAEAGAASNGGMAAIIGLEKSKISEVLKTINGVVVPANENLPEQTVISGEKSAVEAACEKLKEAGAKRAIMLPVSGAFHSPLMKSAAEEFGKYLETVTFQNAKCPVITNVTAASETDGAKLKSLLVEQLLSPVRWVDSLVSLASTDITTAIEVGPGTVLKGFMRGFGKDISTICCGDATSVSAIAE